MCCTLRKLKKRALLIEKHFNNKERQAEPRNLAPTDLVDLSHLAPRDAGLPLF